MSNETNAALLPRLAGLGLNQCYLTAGCLFQTLWNRRDDRAPDWGIKDYDVFYCDEDDLSWEAEDRVIKAVEALTADLNATIEVRNQARVHLWYRQRFHAAYPRLTSSRDGIDRYLIECTCIGIEAVSGKLYAPYGMDDLAAGILRPNPLNPNDGLFEKKAESYRQRWPWLTIAAEI